MLVNDPGSRSTVPKQDLRPSTNSKCPRGPIRSAQRGHAHDAGRPSWVTEAGTSHEPRTRDRETTHHKYPWSFSSPILFRCHAYSSTFATSPGCIIHYSYSADPLRQPLTCYSLQRLYHSRATAAGDCGLPLTTSPIVVRGHWNYLFSATLMHSKPV